MFSEMLSKFAEHFQKVLRDEYLACLANSFTCAIVSLLAMLKVRQCQNEFMKSSFLQKYEQIIVKISALTTQVRNPENFLFVFWEKQ